jgi:hypothetical protein
MKKPLVISLLVIVITILSFRLIAETPGTSGAVEYATLRWAGRENSVLIRPNGKVEPLRSVFQNKAPDRVDERTYYMTMALNAAAKEGFELVEATPDEWILKRGATGN